MLLIIRVPMNHKRSTPVLVKRALVRAINLRRANTCGVIMLLFSPIALQRRINRVWPY